jgi:hypothetical protein
MVQTVATAHRIRRSWQNRNRRPLFTLTFDGFVALGCPGVMVAACVPEIGQQRPMFRESMQTARAETPERCDNRPIQRAARLTAPSAWWRSRHARTFSAMVFAVNGF